MMIFYVLNKQKIYNSSDKNPNINWNVRWHWCITKLMTESLARLANILSSLSLVIFYLGKGSFPDDFIKYIKYGKCFGRISLNLSEDLKCVCWMFSCNKVDMIMPFFFKWKSCHFSSLRAIWVHIHIIWKGISQQTFSVWNAKCCEFSFKIQVKWAKFIVILWYKFNNKEKYGYLFGTM